MVKRGDRSDAVLLEPELRGDLIAETERLTDGGVKP